MVLGQVQMVVGFLQLCEAHLTPEYRHLLLVQEKLCKVLLCLDCCILLMVVSLHGGYCLLNDCQSPGNLHWHCQMGDDGLAQSAEHILNPENKCGSTESE